MDFDFKGCLLLEWPSCGYVFKMFLRRVTATSALNDEKENDDDEEEEVLKYKKRNKKDIY